MARQLTAYDARRVAEPPPLVDATVIPLAAPRRHHISHLPVNSSPRVLLLGGHALERAGLCRLLEDDARLEVIGEAAHDADGAGLMYATRPDVIVVDPAGGSRRGDPLPGRPDNAAVLLLIDRPAEAAQAALRPGVASVLAKSSGPEQLVMAVRRLAYATTEASAAVGRLVAVVAEPTTAAPAWSGPSKQAIAARSCPSHVRACSPALPALS